ncbi:uncharacterized protein LOC143909624 [Arctopsyche grandis]|uniref:uncharacterized protein LOC143909624 n=1 Tax=Arctopsyche grandis TaxID=121162 RepID=UPI00406DA426
MMKWPVVQVVIVAFLAISFQNADADLICISESWRANSIRCRPTGGLFNSLSTIEVFGSKGGGKVNALYLKNCKLISVNRGAFSTFPDTQVLDLSSNSIQMLDGDVFNSLTNLQALNLSTNMLETISPDMFKSLTKLRDLDLSSNMLTINSVESPFKGLSMLRGLDLSNNNEVAVIPDLFLGLNLRTLTMSATNMQFPDAYLLDQPSLSFLDLSNNVNLFDSGYLGTVLQTCGNLIHLKICRSNLEIIESASLRDNNRLRVLNISNNMLSKLDSDLFFKNVVLMDLDLSHNKLQTLPNKIFSRNVEIITLNLSYNMIVKLLTNAFDTLTKLQVLDLKGNRLTTLQNSIFVKNTALGTIDLSNNQFKSISEFIFIMNIELRFLYLRNNQIESFSYDVVKKMNNLILLDLDNNRLTTISSQIMNMVSISELWLSCNNIVSLPEKLFANVDSGYKTLKLHGNPWNCGCLNRLLDFKKNALDYDYVGFTDGNFISCIVGSSPSVCDNSINADDLKQWEDTHRIYSNACLSKQVKNV